jgi:hypothetical protein
MGQKGQCLTLIVEQEKQNPKGKVHEQKEPCEKVGPTAQSWTDANQKRNKPDYDP